MTTTPNKQKYSCSDTSALYREEDKESVQPVELQEVGNWLKVNGYPALPVAPALSAEKYPLLNKTTGQPELDKDGNPKPRFTGKNPSYLDQNGIPHLVNHRQYQTRLPSERELKEWFTNPLNGIGTLGGWNNTIWLDFDVKQFPSEDDCTQAVTELLQNPTLANTFLERSHSGGWRVGVRVSQKPEFTNFALTAGGKHIGEALGVRRFTVLAPTVGPSGNQYQSINRALPAEVESLESIGIYRTSTKRQHQGVTPHPSVSYIPGNIPLEELGNTTSREIFKGNCPTGDRSEALTTALNEWYGWQNWGKENDIPITGTPEDLAHYTGGQLGIDSERIERILKTIDIVSCNPAALHRGGEESCWKKIRRLSRATFEAKCPAHIRDAIKQAWQPNSIGSGGNDGGNKKFTQQNFWNAPVSWHGEIGWLIESKEAVTEKGEDSNKISVTGQDGHSATEKNFKFHPKCNFDFVVERELESEDGGGIVLQVKRSLDRIQKRVIINSVDYGSVKTFEKALKQALGSGIVINLKDEHLKSLIHVRLREYRERGGKSYKLIDRYGQQADGVWVFGDRQFKPDGTPTNEEESNWVFNPALGKEDFIPCPELAPEDPDALKRLVDACRVFFGEKNIHQVLMTMGWVVGGIHSQAIFKHDNCFPLVNPNGEPGACKTLAAEASLSLVGKNWPQMGMLARVSLSALYEHGSRTGSLPFFLDDPERSPEIDEVFKTWYNWKPRRVRGNDQQPKSPVGAITNHVVGAEQAATFTRFSRLTYERVSGGNKQAFQELRKAQETASGAFPLLLKIGYDPKAIATIERDLLPHLPLAHARIAQSLAIPLYYAEKLLELTGYTHSYNLKQWVIENCCKSENDSDNSADSLQDFIDKLLSLESESLVGSWNFKRDIERNGKNYIALFASDAWSLVDKRFKPATYNFKSLKPLVLKAAGVIDTTVRFNRDRDSVLAYERAKITAEQGSNGDLELNPPPSIPRKAWLIPSNLFGGDESPVTGVTECNRISVTPQDDDFSGVSPSSEVLCNCVTEKKEKEIEIEIPDKAPPVVDAASGTFHKTPKNPGYNGYTVTEVVEITAGQGLEPVTETSENLVTVTELSVTEATRGEWEEESNLKVIVEQLSQCTTLQELSTLRKSWNPQAMDLAHKRLTPDKQAQIHEWVAELNSEKFQISDRVYWSKCPAHCQQFAPFEITAIDGAYAKLDLFEKPVLLAELELRE